MGRLLFSYSLKSFRRILNQAVDEQLFAYEKNPFLRYKLAWDKTEKVYLTEHELKTIEEYEVKSGSKRQLHKDAFVFACYAGGFEYQICVC